MFTGLSGAAPDRPISFSEANEHGGVMESWTKREEILVTLEHLTEAGTLDRRTHRMEAADLLDIVNHLADISEAVVLHQPVPLVVDQSQLLVVG